MWQIKYPLIICIRMHSSHQSPYNTKLVEEHFCYRARQFVVHEAFEMILCFDTSRVSSLTPIHIVASGSLAGAEIKYPFGAGIEMLLGACPVRKKPVDSMTMSTFRSFHGSFAGSVKSRYCDFLPVYGNAGIRGLHIRVKYPVH